MLARRTEAEVSRGLAFRAYMLNNSEAMGDVIILQHYQTIVSAIGAIDKATIGMNQDFCGDALAAETFR